MRTQSLHSSRRLTLARDKKGTSRGARVARGTHTRTLNLGLQRQFSDVTEAAAEDPFYLQAEREKEYGLFESKRTIFSCLYISVYKYLIDHYIGYILLITIGREIKTQCHFFVTR